MKVTIDTKEDSYDDLKKVLHLIADILQKKGETEIGNAFGSSSSSSSSSSSQQTPSTADTSNLMSMFDAAASSSTQKNKDTLPQVEIF